MLDDMIANVIEAKLWLNTFQDWVLGGYFDLK